MTAKIDTAKLRRLAEAALNDSGPENRRIAISEKARDFICVFDPTSALALLDKLDAARKVEAAAYERAAQVAEDYPDTQKYVEPYRACAEIAAAIRAFGEEGA